MRSTRLNRDDRGGLTLIELLVTVTILLMITAIAIPVLAPSGDERRVRETSRLVTSFFQGARTRAIQTGRQFGIMIEPLDGNPAAGVQISYAEVQEPYAGDFLDSRINIAVSPTNSTVGGVRAFVSSLGVRQYDTGWMGLIRPGDVIKLGYQGHYFALQPGEPFEDLNADGIRQGGESYLDLDGDGSYDLPASGVDANGYITTPYWRLVPITAPLPFASAFNDLNSDGLYTASVVNEGDGVPFQIFRQPVKTAGAPLTLPEGMVVDLSGSGWGSNILGPEPLDDVNGNGVWNTGEAYTDTNGSGDWTIGYRGPFIILFSPGGAMSSIFLHDAAGAPGSFTPTSTLHLLVGKAEQAPATVGQENWRDLTSLWISIHPQTGLVTATEVGGDQNSDSIITIGESLFFAERGQSMGGR